MYLSSILIDVGENPDRPRPGRLWLRNIYRIHQRLCMAFPSFERKAIDPEFVKGFRPDDFQHVHGQRTAEQAFLFRIDPQPGGNPIIIVQSAIKPDWDYCFRNAGYLLAAPPQVRSYSPHFQNGQLLAFRLMANAICKKDKEDRPQGKNNYGRRVPVPREKVDEWLISRGERFGFRVKEPERLLSTQKGYICANKENDKFKRFFYVRYDGMLEVIDADLLHDSIIRGIGPGKAFGFGLLSLSSVVA